MTNGLAWYVQSKSFFMQKDKETEIKGVVFEKVHSSPLYVQPGLATVINMKFASHFASPAFRYAP
eukprot:2205112-Pyramimonas_sp.AAC.2